MGTYYLCSSCKISRGVSVAASAREHFFIKGGSLLASLNEENLNESKWGTLIKKCFLADKETPTDILLGGHRYYYIGTHTKCKMQ